MKSSTVVSLNNFDGDVLGYWGRNIVEDYLDVLAKTIAAQLSAQGGKGTTPSQRPKPPGGGKPKDRPPALPTEGRDNVQGKVGILGAGVGGLYTALILDSLDIKYEILEASRRTGGRLFTHKFENGNKYDYFDVGAMRYPLPPKDDNGNYKSGVMKRLGELIDYSKLNDDLDLPLRNTLIDYYYKARTGGTFLYFNDQRYQVPAVNPIPPNFNARAMGVGPNYVSVGVDNIVGDVVAPFARMIMEDLEHGTDKGWDVMKHNDAYSLRAYMSFKYIPSVNFRLPPDHLTTNVINWCETFDKSTGWYDRALTEQVLEALAFARVGSLTFGEVEWKCFDGGSHVLTDYMESYITSTAQGNERLIDFGKSVTSISQVGTSAMRVSVRGEHIPRTYSHVISTLPLPCLRTIDLSGAGLNVMQKTALRKLQYGPSIKIGVRFKSAWWTTRFGIVGGQSFTDLPLRTIVYPSYGVDSATPSTVLIASYCWTNDAERLGSLINTGKAEYDEQLKELVLRNLAEVHDISYHYLNTEQYEEMYAWDWNHNPLTGGAFAFFGPGDFQDLYTSLTTPNANRRLHFAGEAISTRHAWVVGALDSAWRAVYEYLLCSGQDAKIPAFFQLWGTNIEWVQPSSQFADDEDDEDEEDGAEGDAEVPGDAEEGGGGSGPGGKKFDPKNTLLRVLLGYTHAAELSGNVQY